MMKLIESTMSYCMNIDLRKEVNRENKQNEKAKRIKAVRFTKLSIEKVGDEEKIVYTKLHDGLKQDIYDYDTIVDQFFNPSVPEHEKTQELSNEDIIKLYTKYRTKHLCSISSDRLKKAKPYIVDLLRRLETTNKQKYYILPQGGGNGNIVNKAFIEFIKVLIKWVDHFIELKENMNNK